MKSVLFILLLSISVTAFAQQKDWRPVYNTRWAYLYQLPDKQSEKIGVLATEASITVIDSTRYFYRIRASNNDIGFIEKQPIETRMFGKKYYNEPKEYFYRGEQGQQTPHRYVKVSGLRARSAPGIKGRVTRVLPINEFVSLDYVPFDEEGWIYIGDHFRKQPEFIQYKYLGEELSFDDALQDYLSAKDEKNRKIMVERLVEVGWSGKPRDVLTALNHFKSFHQKNGSINNYPDLDFEIFMVEQLQNPMDYEERVQYLQKAEIHFEINGKKIYEDKVSEDDAARLGLNKTFDFEDIPECGWEPLFIFRSSDLELVFEKRDQPQRTVAVVRTMQFNKNQALVLNKIKIDDKLSEREFVQSFGRVIYVFWNYKPHAYRIPDGDAGFIEISFKDGKPFKYEVVYYC